MRTISFKIPIYKFSVTLVEINGAEDETPVRKLLGGRSISVSDIESVCDIVRRGAINGGDLFYNFSTQSAVVVFYPMSGLGDKVNIYCHEKRHLEDRVMEFASVNDPEAVAYLAGFLGEKMWDFGFADNQKFICKPKPM